jgi:exosortase K
MPSHIRIIYYGEAAGKSGGCSNHHDSDIFSPQSQNTLCCMREECRASRIGAALAALALALSLRAAVASSEGALRTLLFPIAEAVRFFFGREAAWEAGTGFLIPDAAAALTERCSGLGLFALAFPAIVFMFIPADPGDRGRAWAFCRFFIKAASATAIAAFSSNLLRVLASQALGPIKLAIGLDFYSAHNAEGLLISLGAFLACLRYMERSSKHA